MMSKQDSSTQNVYEVEDIRKILKLGRNRAYLFIQEVYQSEEPPFKVIKIGSLYRIPKESFDQWLKNPC